MSPATVDLPQFEERASAYGLDQQSLGTQAAFFDYDGDGDLDVYLLNSSVQQEQTYGRSTLRDQESTRAGDRRCSRRSGLGRRSASRGRPRSSTPRNSQGSTWTRPIASSRDNASGPWTVRGFPSHQPPNGDSPDASLPSPRIELSAWAWSISGTPSLSRREASPLRARTGNDSTEVAIRT